jgi:cell division protein FtsL
MPAKDFKTDIKRRKWRRLLIIAFGCLIVLSLLFLRIWMLSNAVEIACEINELDVKKQVLKKENEKIFVEITKLKSPDRISEIATNDLNMVRSPDTKVIFIEK